MIDTVLEEALTNMRRFLCTPEYARRLGVMVGDAERPASAYGITTWSGMRMESTGFAGMTLAEMIEPGVLYLGREHDITYMVAASISRQMSKWGGI